MEKIEESDKGIDLNGEEVESGVACSICLDLVIHGGGQRAFAKLQCGHEFHLDCIGSAFNMKGTMQCPNCRKIENGQWLYASGSSNSPPELSIDDGSPETNPFLLSYTEMPYRVHICPFRGLTQVHPSTEASLGIMSTMTPMVNHQHPASNGLHPHGWLQFHHTPFQPHHPLPPGLPMPISNGSGRFDSQRSLPRFLPPGGVYEPSVGFSLYGETPMSYSHHPWVRDNHPHFPLQ